MQSTGEARNLKFPSRLRNRTGSADTIVPVTPTGKASDLTGFAERAIVRVVSTQSALALGRSCRPTLIISTQ